MSNVLQDIRYGVRSLIKAPTFTFLTILTLTLAIGVNSAIFSMLSVVFFAEMPVQDKARTTFLWSTNAERGVTRGLTSVPDFLDYRQQLTAFSELAAMTQLRGVLSGGEEPTRVVVGAMTTNMLDAWGLAPQLGREFVEGEDRVGAERVVMLSHGLWERRFATDPAVLGQEVKLDGEPAVIVGIMSTRMEFGDLADIDLWVPLSLDPSGAARDARVISVTGLLAEGATLEQAQAEAAQLGARLAERYPGSNRGWMVEVQDFQSGLADSAFWVILLLLVITVGLVMLIACSNVATMTLARATGRSQELAIRAAIGAGRGRILRQLVTESLLLSFTSALLGLLVARGALTGLTWISRGSGIDRFFSMLEIDQQVLLFTLGVALIAPVLFGLLPALRSSRTDLSVTLKEGGRTSGDVSSMRGRRVLVAAQVSLAIALMVVAGLLIRSLVSVRSLEFSHQPSAVLTARVDLPEAAYPEMESVRQFRQQVLERIEANPAVARVAWVSARPIADFPFGTSSLEIDGDETRAEDRQPFAYGLGVTVAYFDMLKLTPLAGRLLTGADGPDSGEVALVNAEAVQRFWGDTDPLGRRIRIGANGDWRQVVGVVSNEVFPDFQEPTVPQVYVPLAQLENRGGALLVESLGDALALAPTIRSAVLEVDPEQPVEDIRTQARIISDGMASIDAIASLLGAFALFALAMAGAGIYGVLSFMVAERTREIGIRMALGASRKSVRSLLMRNSGVLVLIGVVVGLAGAYGLGKVLASGLPQVNPADPAVYSVVGVVLVTVAALAAWIPARRATRVEPVIALKAD